MDPNEVLNLIRRAMVDYADDPTGFDAQELIEAVDALDAWLCKGGFPPRDWKIPRQ
jgi:hypothetical protein